MTGDACRQAHPAGHRRPLGNILRDSVPADPATRAAKERADVDAADAAWMGDDVDGPGRSRWTK